MAILSGTLAFAAIDATGYINTDAIRHTRREVKDYLADRGKWMLERYKPVRVMIIPVDLGQT